MKKIMLLFCACVMMFLGACNNSNVTDPTNEVPTTNEKTKEKNTETATPEEKKKIDTMEKMEDIAQVISVTKQSFEGQIKGAVAYKVLYETTNGKLSADVVLPSDYANEGKQYTVLIYFPQVGTYIDSLASGYALNDIIVIRPYARGFGESEGMRDFGGVKDTEDAKKLLEIFDQTQFVSNSKVFVAGSSEGSITAFRLFAEDTEQRISGCAVVDAITDLSSFAEARGEGVKQLLAAFIGKTYEESPGEYDMRSAVKFSEKLDGPILHLHYLQNPLVPIEQTDSLAELLKDNKDYTCYKIDELSADFEGEGHQRLLSWINKYD